MRKAQVVLVVGVVLIVIGFYLASASGLLFGSYSCYGGFACMDTYEMLRLEFWEGIVVLSLGLCLTILGGYLSLKKARGSSITRNGTDNEIPR
jgi:hypothetical protein